MKLKFLGDEFPSAIPTGAVVSLPLQKILDAYSNNEIIEFDYYGRAVEADIWNFIAIKAETLEDTLFLEGLKEDVLSYKKILLCNYEVGLINPDFAYFTTGNYFLDSKWELTNETEQVRTWHYLVSEMVKEAGVPYTEITVLLSEDKKRIERFQLKNFDGNTTSVLYESSDVFDVGFTTNEFLGFRH